MQGANEQATAAHGQATAPAHGQATAVAPAHGQACD